MSRARRIRNVSWALRAVSLLTLMALLVAPNCAPLCAAKSCPQAAASGEAGGSCHGAGAMHHKGLLLHGIRNCNLPELPAVLSTSTGFSGASGASRLSATGGEFLAADRQNSAPTVPFPDNHFGRSPDCLSSFVSVPSSVLRI